MGLTECNSTSDKGQNLPAETARLDCLASEEPERPTA